MCDSVPHTFNHRSYEELVRSQVEAYVAAAQQYAEETALSRRVAQWTSKLEPILDLQESVRTVS